MKIYKKVIKYFLITVLMLLTFSSTWCVLNFNNVSFDEIIFHLLVPLKGTSSKMINYFILTCIVPVICCIFLLIIVDIILESKHVKHKTKSLEKALKLKLTSVVTIIVSVSLAVIFGFNSYTIGIPQYIKDNINGSNIVSTYYVKPQNTKITPNGKKRNLIYILMESMETSYQSEKEGGFQQENLIPNLTHLAKDNLSFSTTDLMNGAYNIRGTDYTAAAMVSQMSGIPLKIPLQPNCYTSYKSYLPGAYSIGDFLKKEGYNQTFMCGSDVTFGGRKDFLNQHGGYLLYDYQYAIKCNKIPQKYFVWWGFEDEKLYSYAQEELLRLSSEDKPFNFTLLTVDTHHINGYKCRLCEDKYSSQYANVINCADRQVNNFINWIKQQDFYENTTIVISGDHPSMDSNFFRDMPSDYERTVYNCFINSAVKTDNIKNRAFCTMDMYPTTLAAMGYNIDGERLGLGTNLFSDRKTVMEEVGKDKFEEEIRKRSNYYSKNILYNK